ncbi:MAG: hypothetical protein ACFFFO_16755 [Candidatus Thorarchaeota archaeon]
MGKEIQVVHELANGGKVMVSGQLAEILAEYKIDVANLWKAFTDTRLCLEPIDCEGKMIQVMGTGSIATATALCIEQVRCRGRQIWVMVQVGTSDICVCPEDDCMPLIHKFTDPGVFVRDPPIFIPFEQILKQIPAKHLKAYTQMIQQMMKE